MAALVNTHGQESNTRRGKFQYYPLLLIEKVVYSTLEHLYPVLQKHMCYYCPGEDFDPKKEQCIEMCSNNLEGAVYIQIRCSKTLCAIEANVECKMKWQVKKHWGKKHIHFFWFLVKDIKIPDIFSKRGCLHPNNKVE